MLKIINLHASIEGVSIIKGVNLTVGKEEIHAIMGPNGSGKSTLAGVLMGKPGITITAGDITLDGSSVLALSPSERAERGIFLGFQYPVEIPGVSARQLLRLACIATTQSRGKPKPTPTEFRKRFDAAATELQLPKELLTRSINDGFSGGEKKKMEMLQCWMLAPRFAMLDETDSGLDVDALKTIARGIQALVDTFKAGVGLITHYQRILRYVNPDRVHVFIGGRIVESGGKELAETIEKEGYAKFAKHS